LLNGVFVETANERAFQRLYERFTGRAQDFGDLAYECKKLTLQAAMSGELHVLARRLDRISEQHRYSRDFTLNSLQSALGQVIACLPVYRSYTRRDQAEVTPEDRRHIVSAIRDAKRRNPATDPSVFDFIASLLLLEDPDGLDVQAKEERRDFVMRLQQLTGPVMAKGLEDTAFYRYCPLASLNEVGGEPARFGVSVELFHQVNQERLASFPHSMLATSTHDTKRSEDVRARINVLSELAPRWYRAVCRWRNLNRDKKTRLEDAEVPDANEEYLLYQTLIGMWPLDGSTEGSYADFVKRIEEYTVKAVKEAKLHSSWISPNEEYEQALRGFVRAVLKREGDNRFLTDFVEFHTPIAHAGMLNSLSQTLLKITSPGVPDFYQGTELWDFSLVDPDNRRPVDYSRRKEMLASLQAAAGTDDAALVDRLIGSPADGRIKLYLTNRALSFRLKHRELFAGGNYRPLSATGERDRQVIAFARTAGHKIAVVVVARLFGEMGRTLPTGSAVWRDTRLVLAPDLGARSYRDVFTGRVFRAPEVSGQCSLRLADVFAHMPAALLERVS
jgi:(1->4)-alpha-D-glucan 1-alpha-D-glucosylmutase